MTRRKRFQLGEEVEVQRDAGFNTPWEAAVYVARPEDMPGWHEVKLLGEPRYIDELANEVTADHPRARPTARLLVPSRRIR